jgi:hypothetical protein
MPYKNPEDKRRWEQKHREQRNARRRTQRVAPGSGQTTARKAATVIAAALRSHRRPATDPGSDQKPTGVWKGILGLVVGVGVVMLAALIGASGFDAGARGSGK